MQHCFCPDDKIHERHNEPNGPSGSLSPHFSCRAALQRPGGGSFAEPDPGQCYGQGEDPGQRL